MFQIHKNVHEKSPLKKEHYDIWLHHYTTQSTSILKVKKLNK